ncbi:MAG: hypothetical protein JO298_08465 [Verrucomicrobia bacterium]|nr:hypothetical protein [Verrucomicrobiota bacterium]
MEIDTRFPTELNSVSDAPEPLRKALVESFTSGEPVRLLVHNPAFTAGEENSPETVLAVTNKGWLVVSQTEDGLSAVEKSDFSDTLFLELKSILLLGQLRICFAGADTSRSVTIKFETVGDELYRKAIDLILGGIDPTLTTVANKDPNQASVVEAWPMKVRNEAQRYWPSGQRLLAATHWSAIFDESQQQLAAAGALLITERELVLFSEERDSSAEPSPEAPSVEEPKERFGGIMTFVPRVRLADFHVSHQESLGILALQVRGVHGGEKLEIIFPSENEKAVSTAMEQMLLSRDSAQQTH